MTKKILKTVRGEKTRWPQKQAIVEWLEVPENFKLIVGAGCEGKKQVVAGKI